MANDLSRDWQQRLTEQQRELIGRLRAACPLLAEAGVRWVEVKYEGAHGKGTLKVSACNSAYEPMPLPVGDFEQTVRDAAYLFLPYDWKTKEGSFGTLFILTGALKVELSHLDSREGGWREKFALEP